MFIALYEIKAKEGREDQFEQAWAEYTDAIHRVRGSLGSRLHETEQDRVYIAYAQWPSREVYYAEVSDDEYTAAELDSRARMRDAVEHFDTLQLMHVRDDRLVTT